MYVYRTILCSAVLASLLCLALYVNTATAMRRHCDELRVLDHDRKQLVRVIASTQEAEVLPLNISMLEDPYMLAIDNRRKLLFFTDTRELWVAHVNDTHARHYMTLTENEDSHFYGIAVDQVNRKVWVADWPGSRIGSVSYPRPGPDDPVFLQLDGDPIDTPINIALDIKNQVLYWTDTTFLGKVNYDGSGLELMFQDLYFPYDIYVDQREKRLYMKGAELIEEYKEIIVSMDMDGSNMKTLLNESLHGHVDMQPLGDYIYMTHYPYKSRGLERISKDGGDVVELEYEFGYAFGIVAYCPRRPRMSHSHSSDNSHSSHSSHSSHDSYSPH